MKASRSSSIAVLAGVVTLLTGCATGSADDSSSPIKSLQLRGVVSQTAGACSAPSASPDVPVTACDRAGTSTYELGRSLGTLTPTSVALSGDQPSNTSITLELDETDTSTLEAATRTTLGKRMAILLDGKVLTAPQTMAPLTDSDVTVAFGSASTARKVYEELHDH